MGTISRLSEKCRKCRFASECNNKRMEAMAYLEPSVSAPAMVGAAAPVTENMLEKHDYRDIKLDENTTVTIDLEELKRQMKKDFYRSIGIGLYPGA